MILGHWMYDYFVGISVGCSVLHTILPPWDILDEFPRAQRIYKIFVYTVGYVAINGRSTVHSSISISKQRPRPHE